MKAHIGVQSRGKPIIHSIETSTAKEHNSIKTEALLHGDKTNIFTDKSYGSTVIKRFYRNNNIFYGITNKSKRKEKLSNKQNKRKEINNPPLSEQK
jgi:superfamily II DNA or RNA helicase